MRAISNRVIVTDMEFGEQKTQSGIVVTDDDGKTRGIHPRWAMVHDIGKDVECDYAIGDWVLIEHGRWTRKFEGDYRMIDSEAIIAYSKYRPSGLQLGNEYHNGELADV